MAATPLAATPLAVAVSLAGLAYLSGTDPKRRRAFRLPPAASSHPRVGWAVVLLPGLVLPFLAGGGGFTVWIGAVSVVGWAIAALAPERTERLAARLGRCGSAVIDRLAAWRPPVANPSPQAADPRIAALEARIGALEAMLAPLPAGDGATAEAPLPHPRRRPKKSAPGPQSSVAAPRSR